MKNPSNRNRVCDPTCLIRHTLNIDSFGVVFLDAIRDFRARLRTPCLEL
eukprot:CAMPEP_0204155010 /NCGR_PEP_ID=MMETSP0361-20130328/29218_1 /ASSEMBLY_ACC=CAM_ASM_000343 /TAXON_ID=268821 /ORGANISM="Scrippsiella Hangoei, Strain SHTV-5" /LENGTH=48 /DNA_ID= /DNA_START= /DNA_END= /DNA_ORIENTATION=